MHMDSALAAELPKGLKALLEPADDGAAVQGVARRSFLKMATAAAPRASNFSRGRASRGRSLTVIRDETKG